MTTEIVPYQQMERMAATVAKSGLFGMKTQEQALSLMLLSQAEGIHPMIAVRDYHIIQGRPSLKTDTMLARFQAAGGKVEWHALTDAKAEATFSHPQGGSVRLSWDMERAKKAQLDQRDNWKNYQRAMLRSRLISEGIRTVFPGVIAGAYTPEEIEAIETVEPAGVTAEQRIDRVTGAPMEQAIVDAHLNDIKNAPDMTALKTLYQEAYKAAKAIGDDKRTNSFVLAYEARKGELSDASKAAA